jgi:signal transduction histidine kinase
MLKSLRFRLPLFLTLYCGVVGLALFTIANQFQEETFERDFERAELVRATEIQSRAERAAERSELETGQREFGELAVFEEIRAAVFVSPQNDVVLSSRRNWIGRPLDLAAIGLVAVEHPRVADTMQRVRNSGRTEALFSLDRNLLTFIMPATVPVGPGKLGATRGALILLVHDLSLSKAVNRQRLLRQFGVGGIAVFLAVVGLGISLQALVTRRIERLHDSISRFAAGAPLEPVDARPDAAARGHDEIAELHNHFNGIAATMRREIAVRRQADEELQLANRALRTISNCNQVLVHATDESTLLREICRVMVRDGGYRVAWVGFAETGAESRVQTVAIASDDREGYARIAWAAQGSGQMAAAIRTCKPAICEDFRAPNAVGPWRDAAVRSGYRACVALPLLAEGRAFGALALCSGEAASFDSAEATLLKELADDLAYGIVALRTRTNQWQAEQALRTANERYARQEAALTTLTATYVSAPGDFTNVVRGITEVVAETLSVALVGVWRHDESGTVTRCQDLFRWPEALHSDGILLDEDRCPAYFRALAGAEVVAVTEAMSDPRTAELAGQLLVVHGITSMMCVPIRSRGATVGVLSCKHVGEARRWMPDEQAFALAVANLLSTLIAHADRQRLEQQLLRAQKLEAIGRLAGGVAHDFNNILTVILGRAEEVSLDRRVPHDLRDAVADLEQNAQRATALTRQLLAFSRRQTIEVHEVDLNSVVANVTRLLHRVLGEDILVSFTYSEQPLAVRADPGMIEQVLLNLAVNARDAMPLGGRLSIDTSHVETAGPSAVVGVPPGTWACVRVKDDGAGIAPEHFPHIFEPFFTTKDIGKGTGLGLATTYGIVQQHGGWIEVDSDVGRGTEFRVFFPRLDVNIPVAAAISQPGPAPCGQETILVVEDEAGVRALVIRLLQDLGYRLLQAQSGPHALGVWRQHGDEVDLLITDVVMPDGMNGVDLADRLRRGRPQLKVIYTSGYLADLSREDILRHADAFIAKPFSLVELAKLIRRTLDGGEPVVSTVARNA